MSCSKQWTILFSMSKICKRKKLQHIVFISSYHGLFVSQQWKFLFRMSKICTRERLQHNTLYLFTFNLQKLCFVTFIDLEFWTWCVTQWKFDMMPCRMSVREQDYSTCIKSILDNQYIMLQRPVLLIKSLWKSKMLK